MLRFLIYLLGKEKPYEPCKGCEVRENEIERLRAENTRLLDTILGLVTPVVHEVPRADVKIEPVQPKIVPWRIKQKELERASRERAESIRAAKLSNPEVAESIADLERELGVDDASK